MVSAGYFRALGLPLIRGRLLEDSDRSGTSRAAVINQRMAEALWPNQDPLGKRIMNVHGEKAPAVFDPDLASIVVGVVGNTHHESLASGFDEEIYFPLTPKSERPAMTVLVRSSLPATQVASELRKVVAEMNPQIPVTHVRTMDEVVAASGASLRSLTLLLVGFGALAVLVGGAGVYSLIAYIVSWREREIGVRLALGAPRWKIVQMVMRQSIVWAIAGSVAGLAVAIAAARLLGRFLYGVAPLDPVTFAAVPLVMLLIALLAAWVPARRAASVDPMLALRAE
jgi:hypothetical protein